eukprot:s730_g10.t1
MGTPILELEKHLHQIADGQQFSVLAELIIRCPGHHVCRTAIHRQLFVTDLPIDFGKTTFTILNGHVTHGGRHPWISASPATHFIQHESVDMCHFNKVIEVCSGIGAVSTGLSFCNASPACFVDYNEKFAEWLDRKTIAPVIHGDIDDPMVIKQISEVTGGCPMPVNGGFACQPFSALGDQRESADPRSNSFPALLKLGYFLRCPIITLECTKEALNSHWVQSQLKAFERQTGYRLHQNLLTLHNTWPSFRTRWWACLSMPMLGISHLPDMPQMDFIPSVMHLMQIHPHLSPEECKQLNLTQYELRHFHEQPQGIASSIINTAKAMPTATHSWGSQLGPCHCGCRQQGFSLDRIAKKGLYGVLIPLGSLVKSGSDWFHGLRHPHPKEVALLNGLDPRYLDNAVDFSLKFLLAGVGQMASPLQGAWVYANLFFQSDQWPAFVANRSTVLFERELSRLDRPLTNIRQEDIDEYVDSQLALTASPGIVPAPETAPVNAPSSEIATPCLPDGGFVTGVDHVFHDGLDLPSSQEMLRVLDPMSLPVFDDIPVMIPFHAHAGTVSGPSNFIDCEEDTPCMTPDFVISVPGPAQVNPIGKWSAHSDSVTPRSSEGEALVNSTIAGTPKGSTVASVEIPSRGTSDDTPFGVLASVPSTPTVGADRVASVSLTSVSSPEIALATVNHSPFRHGDTMEHRLFPVHSIANGTSERDSADPALPKEPAVLPAIDEGVDNHRVASVRTADEVSRSAHATGVSEGSTMPKGHVKMMHTAIFTASASHPQWITDRKWAEDILVWAQCMADWIRTSDMSRLTSKDVNISEPTQMKHDETTTGPVESTHVPPTRFHAMPCPGGPAHELTSDAQTRTDSMTSRTKDVSSQVVSDHDMAIAEKIESMMPTHDPPTRFHAKPCPGGPPHVKDHHVASVKHADVPLEEPRFSVCTPGYERIKHAEAIHGLCESTHVPPTRLHAMPCPGGPSHDVDAGMADSMPAVDHFMVSSHVDNTSEPTHLKHDEATAGPLESTHVPPTRFHAMPCPGGPAHVNEAQSHEEASISGSFAQQLLEISKRKPAKPDPLITNDPWAKALRMSQPPVQPNVLNDHSSNNDVPATYGAHGGISHFAAPKRPTEDTAQNDPKRMKLFTSQPVEVEPNKPRANATSALTNPEDARNDIIQPVTSFNVWIGIGSEPLYKVQVPKGTGWSIGHCRTKNQRSP